MRFKWFVFCAAAALFVPSTAFPTENLVVKLFVTTVKQDSPVQVVGFKYPDKGPGYTASDRDTEASCLLGGYCPKVVLHNAVAKDVRFIAVEGLMGDPARDEDGEAEYPYREVEVLSSNNWKSTSPRLIAANGESEFGSATLWPVTTVGVALKTVESTCLLVAVIVTRVEFSDGTVWAHDPKQNATLWRDSVANETAGSCQKSSGATDTLKQLVTSWSGAPPPHSSTDTIESYSVACPVRKTKDGKLVAVCAW
jgi:hypothetical protein